MRIFLGKNIKKTTCDRMFLKRYGFYFFARNMGKNINENLSSKYNQKTLDHAKKSAADSRKTASKRTIQKPAEATGDLIGNKITDKIAKVSKSYHRIIQKEMKKFIEKNICLRNKVRKLKMI